MAPPSRAPDLAEPPRGLLVCRRCGRIHPIALAARDAEALVRLSGRIPPGWSVERIAYSLTAVCPRCRAGRP
ncbi:MAG: hypothetical protein QXG65_02820 [Thermoplasmata archaeon]